MMSVPRHMLLRWSNQEEVG